MPDSRAPDWLRTWISAQVSSTIFVSVGVSVGGLLSLVAPYFGGDRWAWFFAGTCIPPGLMAFVYSTNWMLRRDLLNLKWLRDNALISAQLYDEQVKRALDWRADRLYGKPSMTSPPGKPRATRRTPASETSREVDNPSHPNTGSTPTSEPPKTDH